MSGSLIEHFEVLPELGVRDRRDCPLIEVVLLYISAIISEFDSNEA
jgi:hypothetical protein